MSGELDLDKLRRKVADEDLLDDLRRPQAAYSADEWLDREFNRGLEAARRALIERFDMPAILAALEEREALRREIRRIFVWSEKRQTVAEVEFSGSHDLSPKAWPAIAAAVREADEMVRNG